MTIYAKSGSTPTVFTESEYSLCCTLLSTTDERGKSTFYTYDDAKRVTDVRTSIQSTSETLVHYEYDCFGNVATVTTYSDASTDRTTSYTYDKNNRVVRIDYPEVDVQQGQNPLASEYFGYNAVGNLLGKRVGVSGANKTSLYKYDDLNRLTDVYYVEDHTGSLSSPTYPTGDGNVHYTYVGGSRLRETMTDEHSIRPTRYTYDLQDRLLTYKPATPRTLGQDEESDTDVRKIGYAYNNLGQKTQMKLTVDDGAPAALEVNYLYYANGWLKEVKKGASSVAAYTYDAVGNRDRVDLGNPTYTTYTYDDTNLDSRYLVDEIGHYGSDDQLLMDYAITYDSRDASGNPTSITDWDNPAGRIYTYDDNNRLASADGTDYDYDWVGNKLRYPPPSPDAMTYDKTDKLVTWPSEHQYTYYPTGSLYQQKSSDGNTVQKIYSYTGANLLSQVVHGDDAQTDPKSTMAWDADGNRVSFTSSEDSTTAEFVYDTTAGIPAVVEEITPADGSFYYIREPGGELIARGAWVEESFVVQHYYSFDELGSTQLITDAAGDMTDVYLYDAWGNTYHIYGSADQPYQYVGRLGYYTHYQDENLDLLQLGVRFYDPETGRFTQTDPADDGLNRYAYASDDPLGQIDPYGLACTPIERAVRDGSTSLLPSPTFVKRLPTEYSWTQVGYEATWGIGWGIDDSMVGCNCIWQRTFREVGLWKRLQPMKQKVSCQDWSPCGYGKSYTKWRSFVLPVFYPQRGNWSLLPRLSLEDTVQTPGYLITTSTGEDCVCGMP
jgi:RHS repeat-associated protein